MSRITFQTGGGRCIDIVDAVEEVISEYYILKTQVSEINKFFEDNGITDVTKEVAGMMIKRGYLKKSTNTPQQ